MSEDNTRAQNQLVIKQSEEDTNGELLEMEAHYPPRSAMPPLHYHPDQAEQFEVLKGTFKAVVDGMEQVYETGERFSVPSGIDHQMQNISHENGLLNWQVRPAKKTQAFLETMRNLEADGKTNEDGVPDLLQLAVILDEYSEEFRASSPPYFIQRLLFGILAPIGRLRGYKAVYHKKQKPT
jgi:quercetin dioxygenase-like cupin family protein